MTLYHINNWLENFETSETRKLDSLKWVPIPNKHDGLGFKRLAAEESAPELLAAWILMLQIASRGRRTDRGKLVRDGVALTSDDLALMTGFDSCIFESALEFFSSPKMMWLGRSETTNLDGFTAGQPAGTAGRMADDAGRAGNDPEKSDAVGNQQQSDLIPASAGLPAANAGRADKNPAEWNGMEWKEGKGKNGKGAGEGAIKSRPASNPDEWISELEKSGAYDGVDVRNEYRKMTNWCSINHKQATKRRFVNWLNRVDRPISAIHPNGSVSPSTPSTGWNKPEATSEELEAYETAKMAALRDIKLKDRKPPTMTEQP